jgi:hypothetical protein
MTQPPLVVISVLNWNGWQDTLECLESTRRLSYPNYLTVVIDNGSWDDSVERIKAYARENLGPGYVLTEYALPVALQGGEEVTEAVLERTPPAQKLVLVRNDENLGFTGGNNVAIDYALHRRAPADYLFFLNNDAVLDRGCLTALVEVDREADAGVVGAVVTDHTGAILFARSGTIFKHFFRVLGGKAIPKTQDEFWESPLVNGAAMFVGSRVLRSVRARRATYFNDDVFMYGDEFDICWAAHREGYKTVVARNAVVSHRVSVRRQGPHNSTRYFYYSIRNRVILSRTLLPVGRRLIFHLFYPPLCVRRMVGRLLAGKPRLAWAISCGLRDGYRGVGGKWKHHDQAASWGDDQIARSPLSHSTRHGRTPLLGSVLEGLRKLSYRPEVIRVVRGLHLSGLPTKLYFWATTGKQHITHFKVSGIEVLFYVENPRIQRQIEIRFLQWEKHFLEVLTSTLDRGDVFLDVGSHLGEFVVPVAKKVGGQGLVVAIEPEPHFVRKLQENLELNGLSNVRIFQKALGERHSQGQLSWCDHSCPSLLPPPRTSPPHPDSSSGDFQTERVSSIGLPSKSGSVAVEVVEGDSLLKSENLPIPRAVKIDVEGYEYSVLRGLKESLCDPACQLLCCEVHPLQLPHSIGVDHIAGLIRSVGFCDIQRFQRGSELHLICTKQKANRVTS